MTTPTLFDWAGGAEALSRLTHVFYARVRKDELLAPVFAHMPEDHPEHVATWFGEVLGGPPAYTEEHGGYPHMMRKHLGVGITEEQRKRWVALIGPRRSRVPLRVPRVRRVGDADRAGQLGSGGEPAAAGARAQVGLGRGAALPAASVRVVVAVGAGFHRTAA
jgi:truncated hemoglobin YjbI